MVQWVDIYLLFFTYRVADTEHALCNSSIITIFSATSAGDKTLQNAEGWQHTV
jgi:hypothetical protein